jgi:hypothetical protein
MALFLPMSMVKSFKVQLTALVCGMDRSRVRVYFGPDKMRFEVKSR